MHLWQFIERGSNVLSAVLSTQLPWFTFPICLSQTALRWGSKEERVPVNSISLYLQVKVKIISPIYEFEQTPQQQKFFNYISFQKEKKVKENFSTMFIFYSCIEWKQEKQNKIIGPLTINSITFLTCSRLL